MGAVFISYRRGDSEGQARALFIELSEVVGKDSVFMDVDSIALGRDFREVLHERLESCELMLALIGPGWLTAKDGTGNLRLDNPGDYVRQEISTALKRNIPVTPVLLQGAQVPDQSQLPEDLKNLAYRNGFELSHSRWESDVREMVHRLGLRRIQAGQLSPRARPRWLRWGGVSTILLAIAIALWFSVRERPSSAPNSARAVEAPTASNSEREVAGKTSMGLEYPVGPGYVYLEIIIGNAQLGTSRVTLDGQSVAAGTGRISLGLGASLVGKVLSVTTVVSDVNPGSNRIAVRYRLSGGQGELRWTVSNPTSTEGTLLFQTSVRLIG